MKMDGFVCSFVSCLYSSSTLKPNKSLLSLTITSFTWLDFMFFIQYLQLCLISMLFLYYPIPRSSIKLRKLSATFNYFHSNWPRKQGNILPFKNCHSSSPETSESPASSPVTSSATSPASSQCSFKQTFWKAFQQEREL